MGSTWKDPSNHYPHEFRIKETKEVWEGEVVEISPEEVEDPHGGYGKVVQSVIVGLKTTKGQKQLKLDPSIYENI